MHTFKAIEFSKNQLTLIDQRALPLEETYLTCKTLEDVIFAIKDMVVRGAPAIGATAAYGMVIGAVQNSNMTLDALREHMDKIKVALDQSRPTAVNLQWATERMVKHGQQYKGNQLSEFIEFLKGEADAIYYEDAEFCKAIGEHGNTLIESNDVILTHCNTGALATVAYGTALGVIREAHKTGKNISVYADETRPRQQGAKLTAWELMKEEIPATLIVDSAAATLIRDGKINKIIVGADRIASNGDTANKIGTFMLSVIAKQYDVPFYVAAPTSTIDYEIQNGDAIEIELRSEDEVTLIGEERIAPKGIAVYNPAFDVTPCENITAIVTERGVVYPPFGINLKKIRPEE